MENQLIVVDIEPVTTKGLQQQVNAIQSAMRQVMEEGVHYGKIPGCGEKPTLLKPGAEKIGLMFRLIPTFTHSVSALEGGHREYQFNCELKDLSGRTVGQGVGLCSTLENRYRYRNGERKCPACGKAAMIKGKEEYGGGWVCFAKKGGCGAKYVTGDPAIEKQSVGQVENPNIADTYNTVLKIAKKRAHVDAILTCTAASDIFTQDIEDMGEAEYASTPFRGKVETKKGNKKYVYKIDTLQEDKEKYEAVLAYLDENGAAYDVETNTWESTKELSKLARCLERVKEEGER